jgi:hypothetical protein
MLEHLGIAVCATGIACTHLATSGIQKHSLPSLMLKILPLDGIWMSEAVRTNSPIDGSSVNTLLPDPTLITMQQLLPYMQ